MIKVRIKYEETVEKEIVLGVDEAEVAHWLHGDDLKPLSDGELTTDLAKEFLESARQPWDYSLSDVAEGGGTLVERTIASAEVLP